MLGVPKELIEHALKVDPKATPKKQRLRVSHWTSEKPSRKSWQNYSQQGSSKRFTTLSGWLALYSSKRKNNNEWRMCVDYTDVNKHCPKDSFGLPRIDQVIDSTAGCVLLSFLDCYSGYHQIVLKEEDQIKTALSPLTGHTPTRPCPSG